MPWTQTIFMMKYQMLKNKMNLADAMNAKFFLSNYDNYLQYAMIHSVRCI